MLVDHVPLPVVLSGKQFTACEVLAALYRTMETLRLFVFVVYMSIQMRFRTEFLVTSIVGAGMLAIVIPLVVVQLVNLIKIPATFLAYKNEFG